MREFVLDVTESLLYGISGAVLASIFMFYMIPDHVSVYGLLKSLPYCCILAHLVKKFLKLMW